MQNNMFGNIIPPQMMNNLKGMTTQAIGGMKQMGQMATEAETILNLVSAYKSGNLLPAIQQMAVAAIAEADLPARQLVMCLPQTLQTSSAKLTA